MAHGGELRLSKALEDWFAVAKRPMPWRRRPSSYFCWLSEILMQQTTFAAVLPYYERFVKRFPSVEALAAATEADVLKAWEGLGYYARARNLLKAARMIVAAGGVWPTTTAGWRALPGVGPYTAAALSSVLNGAREPVVDGNVARVFARHWLADDDFTKLPARARLAERLRPAIATARVPGDFNQAMMELGACVCTPRNPQCGVCPLARTCAAHQKGVEADYPVKRRKAPLGVRRTSAIIVTDGEGRVLLVQNKEGGLLRGLWELPTAEEAGVTAQTFSHFKLEQTNLRVARTDAAFVNPAAVPLTTATRKALGLTDRK